MEIIRDLRRIGDYPNPVVTIGNFDGVHRGHQKIFSRVVTEAERIGGTPIAITFEPHPVRVLYPEEGTEADHHLPGQDGPHRPHGHQGAHLHPLFPRIRPDGAR
ncbi:MAG: hypothetical protein MZV70_65795 [Desulfobacterales bacterium]|nr:hypothetical protein [Desulfobacterales bacterium]